MAERVKVVARNGRSALLDARVARVLVAKGSHRYATAEMAAEPAKPKKVAKKRTYKRRDMKAED